MSVNKDGEFEPGDPPPIEYERIGRRWFARMEYSHQAFTGKTYRVDHFLTADALSWKWAARRLRADWRRHELEKKRRYFGEGE